VVTSVSKERIAFIFRFEATFRRNISLPSSALKMKEMHPSETLVTTYISTLKMESMNSSEAVVTSYTSNLKIEAILSSEALVTTYKSTWRHNPEDHNRHLHRCENLKSQRKSASHKIRRQHCTLYQFYILYFITLLLRHLVCCSFICETFHLCFVSLATF
jgi:hypothetical protein